MLVRAVNQPLINLGKLLDDLAFLLVGYGIIVDNPLI